MIDAAAVAGDVVAAGAVALTGKYILWQVRMASI